MAQIAYLLLCHKNAPRVIEQARILTSKGDHVVIHPDANAGAGFRSHIETAVAANANCAMARSERCGWGEWSLVAATLNMVRTARTQFPDATHHFLMSGDCMPAKPAHYIHSELDRADTDQIEHADFFTDNWIKTGMQADRLHYRHWFNERSQKSLFYASLDLQRKLGLSRRVPKGIRMRIGSQWWVLRTETIDKILTFIDERRDVLRFFKTTWIPDETFFQTLVMHLVPREQVISAPPTYLMFSDYGMPVTFCADHYDLLRTQGQFFARKISDHDDNLRSRLGELFMSDDDVPATVESGRSLYDYLRKRGREGRRFGERVWSAGGRLGRKRRVAVIVCKKWHVAKRVVEALADTGRATAFGFVFDEEEAGLPEMGNLQNGVEKRNRHRRSYLNVLFEQTGRNDMIFCSDPSNIDLLRDLASDGCDLHVLEIACSIDDNWLEGHAFRIGLGSRSEAGGLHAGLMATLRQNIADETAAITDLGLAGHRKVSTSDAPGALARPMADVFGITIDQGGRVAQQSRLSEE